MKNKPYLLLSILCLTSCGQVKNSEQSNSINQEESSNKETSSIIDTSSSIESSSSLSSLQESENYVEVNNFSTISEIYLSIGETYNLEKMLFGNYKIGLFKKVLANSSITIDENGIISAVNEGDCTLSLIKNNEKQDITIHVTNYDEYGSYFISTDLGRLYNKNVIFFGDSITHNWLKYTHEMELVPGYDGTSQFGYLKYLNEKCHFSSITNAACSGGTMSTLLTSERPLKKSFDYCVEANKENIANADYIFIWYGTNDYTDQANITTSSFEIASSANEKSSFDGAMRYGINKILEYKNNAQIIVLNILYRSLSANGRKYTITDYNNKIESICRQYMCKYIDMYSLLDDSSCSKYLNNDGLHPNDAGYKLVADYILSNGENKNEN